MNGGVSLSPWSLKENQWDTKILGTNLDLRSLISYVTVLTE